MLTGLVGTKKIESTHMLVSRVVQLRTVLLLKRLLKMLKLSLKVKKYPGLLTGVGSG